MRDIRSAGLLRRTMMVAGATVFALVAASCSSSSSKTTPATASPGTTVASTSAPTTGGASDTTVAAGETTTPSTAATTTPAADPLGTPNAASGDPIIIGTINEGGADALSQQSANTLQGIQIAAKYANEYLGGIAGHPIQIESCGNKATPAGATDCANQMVEKKINAYIMPYSAQEAVIVKILTAAGIPMVLAGSSTTEGLTTPGVFAIGDGYPAVLGAFAIHAKENGVKNFAMLVTDVPAATGGANALGGITFKKEGVQYQVVAVPVGTADMSAQMQSAIAAGADAIGATGDASFCTSFLQAYKTLALTAKKYLISVCVDPSVISSAGDVLDGSYVGVARANGPDDAIYAAATAKYGDGSIDPNPNVSSGIADGWGSMMDLVNAMQGYTGPIDPASITAQMKAAKDIPIPLSGGLTFTCDGKAISILANICSSGVQIAVVDAKGVLSGYEKIDAAEAYAS